MSASTSASLSASYFFFLHIDTNLLFATLREGFFIHAGALSFLRTAIHRRENKPKVWKKKLALIVVSV